MQCKLKCHVLISAATFINIFQKFSILIMVDLEAQNKTYVGFFDRYHDEYTSADHGVMYPLLDNQDQMKHTCIIIVSFYPFSKNLSKYC